MTGGRIRAGKDHAHIGDVRLSGCAPLGCQLQIAALDDDLAPGVDRSVVPIARARNLPAVKDIALAERRTHRAVGRLPRRDLLIVLETGLFGRNVIR